MDVVQIDEVLSVQALKTGLVVSLLHQQTRILLLHFSRPWIERRCPVEH